MTADQALFLGVDGGGTHCRARLVDATGRRLGEGQAGASNIRLGLEASWRQLRQAIDRALAEAHLGPEALPRIRAGLGIAGIMGPADIPRILAGAPPFASAAVETDAHTACLGAFGGRDGAILILGTGSVGFALVGGQPHSVGGWGFEISDDGSGARIGSEAVRMAVRAYDGLGPASDFTRAVVDRFGGHPRDVVAWVNNARPAEYGGVAPMAFEHAERGDPVATTLIQAAAGHVETYIDRLAALGAKRIALMGGVAAAIAPWLSPRIGPLLAEPESDALDGALLLARRPTKPA